MWLPWDYALGLACMFGAAREVVRRRPRSTSTTLAAFLGEATIIALLYAGWQFAGRLSIMQIDNAFERGQQIWDLERAWHLPDEGAVQRQLLPHRRGVQAANIYYAGFHVPGMGVFLLWLFTRHRSSYTQWRNSLAALTGVCLAIQLVPVAPPRLIKSLGLVDTGIEYGMSVYATMGSTQIGQLQAMPSLHIGWAAVVAAGTVMSSQSRWRWIGLAHLVVTFYVITVTGNHYWLDGLVAIVLLIPIIAVASAVEKRRAARRTG